MRACVIFENLISELLIIQHDVALELHPMRRGMSCLVMNIILLPTLYMFIIYDRGLHFGYICVLSNVV